MEAKIQDAPAKENAMQLGDPLPPDNTRKYISLSAFSVSFSDDKASECAALINRNRKDDQGNITERGPGENVSLDALSPEVLAAIQTITDAFAAQLGV